MSIPKTIIHLLSGGLDSVTMLYDLQQQGHAIHALLVDYKQPQTKELLFGIKHCARCNVSFTTMEIPALGRMKKNEWVVPNRNAILISLAANLALRADAQTITIGVNKDDADMFPDCRPDFIHAMSAAVRAAGYTDMEVCAPYIDWPKWKIGGLAQEFHISPKEIWTCYVGGEKPCGKCPACVKLKKALR